MSYIILLILLVFLLRGIARLYFYVRNGNSQKKILDMILLRLELDRIAKQSPVNPIQLKRWLKDFDSIEFDILNKEGLIPGTQKWTDRRIEAWRRLEIYLQRNPGTPPWDMVPPPIRVPEKPVDVSSPQIVSPDPLSATDKIALPTLESAPESIVNVKLIPTISPSPSAAPLKDERHPIPPNRITKPERPKPEKISSDSADTHRFAWEPKRPGIIERALHNLTGISSRFVPFFVQNIGWFLSVFFFVSGSIFLITCTQGFLRALIISGTLFAYTGIMLYGGYRLRLRSPDLQTAGDVLMTLGMLLIPLSIAAAVRMVSANVHSSISMAMITGSVLVCVNLSVFFWFSQLVSGVMDRSLQKRHSQVYMLLCAMQLAIPVLERIPLWVLAAAFHALIFGLLSYGLIRFSEGWLKSIFIERRRIAWYSAGTILYAAAASFIHLTWSYTGTFPAGYYGPFVMGLCGLLFYVDSRIKQWVDRHTYLSLLSFGIYALSVVAVAITFTAPDARLITLLLGVFVYGTLLWYYTTPVPLYLLLACLASLYGLLILKHVPWSMYFLTSLPGLSGLIVMQRWLSNRNAVNLARIAFRVFILLCAGLSVWSLYHAEPGWIATGTGFAMTLLVYMLLRYSLANLFQKSETELKYDVNDLRNTNWFYLVPFSAMMTLVYFPLITEWHFQLSVSMLAMAGVCTGIGLKKYRYLTDESRIQTTILLNSGILSVVAATLMIVFPSMPLLPPSYIIPILATGAAILLWQSLQLRVRPLFYGAILYAIGAGALIKLTYFPAPSVGFAETLLGCIVWALLWRIERVPEEIKQIRQEQDELIRAAEPQITLLGCMACRPLSIHQIVTVPIQEALVGLWIWPLYRLGAFLLSEPITSLWVTTLSIHTMLTMLLMGRFRIHRAAFVPMLMGLAAILGCMSLWIRLTIPIVSATVTLYALLSWRMVRTFSASEKMMDLFVTLNLRDEAVAIQGIPERICFRTSLFLTVSANGLAMVYGLDSSTLTVLPALVTGMLFFYLSSRAYPMAAWVYGTILHAILSCVVIQSVLTGIREPEIILAMPSFGLSFSLMSLTLCIAGMMLKDLKLWGVPLGISGVILGSAAACQQFLILFTQTTIPPLPVLNTFLCAVAFGLAAKNFKNRIFGLIAVIMGSIGIMSLETMLVHPGLPFTVFSDHSDWWIALALLSTGLAIGHRYLMHRKSLSIEIEEPLLLVSIFAFGWAMVKAVWHTSEGLSAAMTMEWAPLFFAVLIVPLFLITEKTKAGHPIREAGMLILLTGFASSVVSFFGLPGLRGGLGIAWSYVLWGIGAFVVPYVNRKAAALNVSNPMWHWAGLMLLLAVPYLSYPSMTRMFHTTSYWVALSLYFFLLLRNSSFPMLSWCAVGTLMLSGIMFIAGRKMPLFPDTVISVLVWANVLLGLLPIWRRYGDYAIRLTGWKTPSFEPPLLVFPKLISWTCLMVVIALDAIALSGHGSLDFNFSSIFGVATLVCMSFVHIVTVKPNTWNAHSAFLSALFVIITAGVQHPAGIAQTTLFLSIWSGFLFIVYVLCKRRMPDESIHSFLKAMSFWIIISPIVTLAALIGLPVKTLAHTVMALGICTIVFAGIGLQRNQSFWVWAGQICGLITLHVYPTVFVPSQTVSGLRVWQIGRLLIAKFDQLQILLPWYALQLAIVILGIWTARRYLSQEWKEKFPLLQIRLLNIGPIFILALAEWGAHLLVFIGSLHPMAPENAWIHGIAALLTAGLLIIMAFLQVRETRDTAWVYIMASIIAASLVYVRLFAFGRTPPMIVDTVLILGAAIAAYICGRMTTLPEFSAPMLNLSSVLPLISLLIVPWHFGSAHASAALLGAGTLYVSLSHARTSRWMLYFGVALINAALYLWIPLWTSQYNLLQLYVVPASLSVLILLHLHQKELKRSVLNKSRLVAICALYVSATMDVFMQPELSVFILAIGLSLIGIFAGISLRIRAFLYGGVIFVVMNVLGQLIRFYPDQGLGKGVTLIILGATIMLVMIWVNVKKESLLRHIRIFRSDLENWA